MALTISFGAASPCTAAGNSVILVAGKRRSKTDNMSWMAAPVAEVPTPTCSKEEKTFCLCSILISPLFCNFSFSFSNARSIAQSTAY